MVKIKVGDVLAYDKRIIEPLANFFLLLYLLTALIYGFMDFSLNRTRIYPQKMCRTQVPPKNVAKLSNKSNFSHL